MLEWYNVALITMAVLSCIIAWHVPRAVLWVGFGVFSYVTSYWWHGVGLPFGTLYGAATNMMICLFIYWMGNTKWEMRVFSAFILMLLIDLLYAISVIADRFTFAVTLEVINAYAMLVITGAGIMDRIKRHGLDFGRSYRCVLDSLHSAVFSKREAYPKWWKHR